jgi:hypothetical protein
MRKLFLVPCLCLLATAWLAGQTITVTAPAAGATWCLGGAVTINWNAPGVGGPISIKLRRAGAPDAPPVLDIAAATANSGSCAWTIPASLPPGSYLVRVRTVSDAPLVYGDSGDFTIAACGAPPPAPPPAAAPIVMQAIIDPCLMQQNAMTDLVLEDVQFMLIYHGDMPPTDSTTLVYQYSFVIYNAGPKCLTSLKWKMTYHPLNANYRRKDLLPCGQFDSSRGQWVLRAGERKRIGGYLNKASICSGIMPGGEGLISLIRIIVDPDNDHRETNEGNNSTAGAGCTPDGYVIIDFPEHLCDREW